MILCKYENLELMPVFVKMLQKSSDNKGAAIKIQRCNCSICAYDFCALKDNGQINYYQYYSVIIRYR